MGWRHLLWLCITVELSNGRNTSHTHDLVHINMTLLHSHGIQNVGAQTNMIYPLKFTDTEKGNSPILREISGDKLLIFEIWWFKLKTSLSSLAVSQRTSLQSLAVP